MLRPGLLLYLLAMALLSSWTAPLNATAMRCRTWHKTVSTSVMLGLRGGGEDLYPLTDKNRSIFSRAWEDNQFFALADSQQSQQKGEEEEITFLQLTEEEKRAREEIRRQQPWFGAEDDSSHLEEDVEAMRQQRLEEAGLTYGEHGVDFPPPPTEFENQYFDSDEKNAGNQLNWVSEDVYEGLRRDVEGGANETREFELETGQDEEEAQHEIEFVDTPPLLTGTEEELMEVVQEGEDGTWISLVDHRFIVHNVTVFNVSDAEGYAEAVREKKVVAPVTLTASASVLSAIFAKFVKEFQRESARASRMEFSVIDNSITTILKGATMIGCKTRQQIEWSLGQIKRVLQVGFEVGATSGQVSRRMRQRARQLRDTNVVRAKEMRLVEEAIKLMEQYDTFLPDTPYEDEDD